MAVRTKNSEISKIEYDVFLSFRGPDTRQGFTDVLYDHLKESGIHVFRDDDELAIGDKIELILEAITNSKICIPIFSKTFACSAWCLCEVAKMVELNKDIVPIFYDVTPDDVKLKTPLYVDQMKKYERGPVEEWESALMEVGRIKGRALNKTSFVEFRNKFTEEIGLKLRVQKKDTIDHFVEMPDEVEKAIKLLEIGSADVRFLGMYGMGGVGKTTLAKIIFNQISSCFDSCSFLKNIREVRSCKGLEPLQTKLLQDLNHKARSKNMDFRLKSVLIVLDDVGERSHIEELVGDSISFGSGSRIIITTRDERALRMNVVATTSSGEGSTMISTTCVSKMEVNGMNREQAMQLFSRHAFGRDAPPKDYTSLSMEVVSISGGLPLALEVIGSHLYGMNIEAWKDKVKILKKIPEKHVQEKLMMSYDNLEDSVKEIYLDIACFFIDEDRSHPFYMWEASDLSPEWAIQVLLSMSLIKITDDNKFWMHDQLRDMGREIIRTKCSRIQTYDDVLSVQRRYKEKAVVGLRVRGYDDHLTDLSNFNCLRFLHVLGDVTFHHRTFWQLSTNLSWLSMTLSKPNFTAPVRSMLSNVSQNRESSYMMKLAVLDLSGSAITDNWDGWILIQALRRLKVLNLSGCTNLSRTPNFSKMESLERLILCWCGRLTKIDRSIGKLTKLKYLNLEFCTILEELPEEVGNLEDVEQIIMTSTKVSKLPVSIGKLKNLLNLVLEYSQRLNTIPSSIGLLVKLKHLKLSSSSLDKLPDSIGDLTSLVNLDLSDCAMIKELPGSVTRLKKLETLILGGCCKLVKLPNDLGNLESLVKLDLSNTSVVVLPESIGNLTRLQVINLSGNDALSALPGSIAQLSLLQQLDISNCDRIKTIRELPTSLTNLKLNVQSMRQTPNLLKLNQLRKLKLDDMVLPVRSHAEEPPFNFDAMGMLLSLESLDLDFERYFALPTEFTALTRLKSLKLSCSNLVRIPPFPSSLESLTLRKVRGDTNLSLSNLNNLLNLELQGCWRDGGMDNLRLLGVYELESLESLSIIYCPTMSKHLDISQLKSLVSLRLDFCTNLVEILGLSTSVSLVNLFIAYCPSLKRLQDIENSISLRCICILGCKKFRGIQGLEKLNMALISIKDCKCKDIGQVKTYY